MGACVNLLLLSFYYEPDLSAGSFRTAALVRALRARFSDEVRIHVITSMPNRYASHTVSVTPQEESGQLRITRLSLPPHRGGMRAQVQAFTHFFFKSLRVARKEHYDAVFATSSRLFTGFLGAIVARRQKAPLYFDVRDLFVDTLGDIMPRPLMRLMSPFLRTIERFTFKTAARVNVVSEGFLPYCRERFQLEHCDVFTNGIDSLFLTPPETVEKAPWAASGKKIVLYAGNMGEGQGLEKIIPPVAEALAVTHHFVLIGDGGRREALLKVLEDRRVENVSLLPPVERKALVAAYLQADILFLHLNDCQAFLKVLPSKLFEYAAFTKPIAAGVAGYAEAFIAQELPDVKLFKPCDAERAVEAILNMPSSIPSRRAFMARFARDNIMQHLAESLFALSKKEHAT